MNTAAATEWVLATPQSHWDDLVEDGPAAGQPRYTVEFKSQDGRILHAFHAGPEHIEERKAFYSGNPLVRAQIQAHQLFGEPGWLVVQCKEVVLDLPKPTLSPDTI